MNRCLIHDGNGGVSFIDVEVAEPDLHAAEPQALVRSEMTGVSPGTELRLLTADFFGGAYVPGYCVVGTIEEPSGADGLPVGTRVLCPGGDVAAPLLRGYGGHQQLHRVPASSLIKVPAVLSPEHVVLNKLASIAYRGTRVGRAGPGQHVLVIGLGIIGQIAARLWAEAGATVTAVDQLETRVGLATSEHVRAVTELSKAGDAFDAVVDCTGVPEVMTEALPRLRQDPWTEGNQEGPIYILQGSYLDDVRFDYETAFQRQASIALPRDSTHEDQQATLHLIERGRLTLKDLLTHVQNIADAPTTYGQLLSRDFRNKTMGIAFRWNKSTSL